MEKRVVIDSYGYRSYSDRFQRHKKQAYKVDSASDSITYICFAAEVGKQPVHRIETSGTVQTISWAYGYWDDRANMDYSMTLNDALAIDLED